MSRENQALASKVKSIFGNRLLASDYEALLLKNNLADVVSYLKQETYFGDCLQDVTESLAHRAEIEGLLSADIYSRFARLIKYGSASVSYYEYGIVRHEINQILAILRSLKLNASPRVITKLPVYVVKHMSFNVALIPNIKTLDDLLNMVKGSEYEKIISQNATSNNVDYLKIEALLNDYYYKIIKSHLRQKSSSKLTTLFKARTELYTITKIYRLKKYFKADAKDIRDLTVQTNFKINKATYNNLVESRDDQEFLKIFSETYYGRFFELNNFLFIEHTVEQIMLKLSLQNLYFAQDPDLMLFSYLELARGEVENIINIVEGIRYELPKDEIRNILIII